MSTATIEIYRTESGAVYEVVGDKVRRVSVDGRPSLSGWQTYRSISRIPAGLFRPGEQGEVLEVLLADGRRITTSRLVPPFAG
jgi:hypothetical protein